MLTPDGSAGRSSRRSSARYPRRFAVADRGALICPERVADPVHAQSPVDPERQRSQQNPGQSGGGRHGSEAVLDLNRSEDLNVQRFSQSSPRCGNGPQSHIWPSG